MATVGSAVDWLGNNADKTIEELNEDEAEEGALDLQPGETARSLLCKDCGKKFRTTAQAEFHANKTCVTTSTFFSSAVIADSRFCTVNIRISRSLSRRSLH